MSIVTEMSPTGIQVKFATETAGVTQRQVEKLADVLIDMGTYHPESGLVTDAGLLDIVDGYIAQAVNVTTHILKQSGVADCRVAHGLLSISDDGEPVLLMPLVIRDGFLEGVSIRKESESHFSLRFESIFISRFVRILGVA